MRPVAAYPSANASNFSSTQNAASGSASGLTPTLRPRTLANGVGASSLSALFYSTVADLVYQPMDCRAVITKLDIHFNYLNLDDPYLGDAIVAGLQGRIEKDDEFVSQLESFAAKIIAGREECKDGAANASLLKFTSLVSALCDAIANDQASVPDILTQLIVQLERVATLQPAHYSQPTFSPRTANSSANSSNGKAEQKQQEALAKAQEKEKKKAKKEQEKSARKAKKGQEKSDKKAEKEQKARDRAVKHGSAKYEVPPALVPSHAASPTGNHYPLTSPIPHHVNTVHNAFAQPVSSQPLPAPTPTFQVFSSAVIHQGQVVSPFDSPASLTAFAASQPGIQPPSPWDMPHGS